MKNEPEFHELLVDYIRLYEESNSVLVSEDQERLNSAIDMISEFIDMFNESLIKGQQERYAWLMLRYGTVNNFKLLIEWVHHGLGTEVSIDKQDNLAQSQENIISFLVKNNALQKDDILHMIKVLKRREVSGYSDRPRKLLEFHLNELKIKTDEDQRDSVLTQGTVDARIKDFFGFMLNVDRRKHQQILSDSDFSKLVGWVSYYFTNNLSIPEISSPIKSINTTKGVVIQTFKLFFKEEHPAMDMPDSLFSLIKACFHKYREDDVMNLRKTNCPRDYKEINMKAG